MNKEKLYTEAISINTDTEVGIERHSKKHNKVYEIIIG